MKVTVGKITLVSVAAVAGCTMAPAGISEQRAALAHEARLVPAATVPVAAVRPSPSTYAISFANPLEERIGSATTRGVNGTRPERGIPGLRGAR